MEQLLKESPEELAARMGVPASLPFEKDEAHLTAPNIGNGAGLTRAVHRKTKALTTAHLTNRVAQLMETFGLPDPIQVLMEIAAGKETYIAGKNPDGSPIYGQRDFKKTPDHKTRAYAAAELTKYIYPARKAVEVSGNEGQPISFQVIADQTEIPIMPSDEELEAMAAERRQQAIDAERTIEGRLEE